MEFQRAIDPCTSAHQMYPPPSPNPQPTKKRRTDAYGASVSEFSFLNPEYTSHIHPLNHTSMETQTMATILPPPSASSPLFTHLSEDLLVCICEHFDVRELARLDCVCRGFRNLLNLPENGDPAPLHGHAANYIWRNAALSPRAWPFPKYIDREHLERVVLKHLKDIPPRTASTATSDPTTPAPTFTSHAIVPYGSGLENLDFLGSRERGPGSDSYANSSALPPSTSHTILEQSKQTVRTVVPPLNWKAILASVSSRTAARGTGTCVLDMGSCTVSVGIGGPDAGKHGTKEALPISFPAIALNDLVGDQIGSASVRSINPVSSISMPILHANETGEFSYCSPIWKYALSRVPESAYCGRPSSTASKAGNTSSSAERNPAVAAGGASTKETTIAPTETMVGDQQSVATDAATASVTPPAPSSQSLPTSGPLPSSLPPSLHAAHSAITAALADPSSGGTVLICDQLLGSKLELAKKRAKVARILFALQPPDSQLKLAFCNESFLSLLNTGKTTGVVLHVGFSRSTCAIFVNGRIQNLSSLPTRMVGGHIHSRIMLQALFSRRQFQPAVADMFAVIPLLKEMCYVSEDTAAEQQKPREVTHVEITITDKKLTLGHERFTSSDVFFLYGFPAMVVEALQSSPAWPVLQKTLHQQQQRALNGQGYPQQIPPAPQHVQSTHQHTMAMGKHQAIPAAEHMPLRVSAHGQRHLEALSTSAVSVPPSSAALKCADDDDHSMSDVVAASLESSRPTVAQATQNSTESMVDHLQAAYQHLQGAATTRMAASTTNATNAHTSATTTTMNANSPSAAFHSAGTSIPVRSAFSSSHSSHSDSSGTSSENEEDEPHQLIKTLLQSIVLSGRSTSLRGFAQRFERDLNAILKQNTPAKVHENHVECTWLGGSVLSSLSIFPALSITREEFVHDGINAILRHMEI